MLGANFIIVGSVELVGNNYSVNTRLVDAEMASVVATSYEEIPASAFEKEASPYLKLVPTYQSIGLYFLNNVISDVKPAAVSNASVGTIEPKDFDLHLFGLGLRYFPHKNIVLDGAYMIPAQNYVIGTDFFGEIHLTSSRAIRGSLGYTAGLSQKINWTAGIGVTHYNFHAVAVDAIELNKSVIFSKAGIEFRPQQRLGLGLNALYNFNDLEAINSTSNSPIFTIEPLSFEGTFTFYF